MEKLRERFPLYQPRGLYFYEGILHSEQVPLDILLRLPNMEMRSDDCLVTGFTKSGTTWLQEIVWILKNNADLDTAKEVFTYDRVPYLEGLSGELDGAPKMPSPRTFKTHCYPYALPKQTWEKNIKIVHIIRNPKDNAVSCYHFYRGFESHGLYKGTFSQFLEMFKAGYLCNGDWFEYERQWWDKRNESNVLIITYEELKKRTPEIVQKLANFLLGAPLESDKLDAIVDYSSFKNMKQNKSTNILGENVFQSGIRHDISPFMRKGTIGNWKEHFTTQESEEFERLVAEKLKDTGFKIEYE